MAVCSGKVVCAVTLDAVGVRGDRYHPRTIERILQQWWCCVAVAALVAVDCHRIVGTMTADTERGVEDVSKACGRVVDVQMGGGCLLVPMAVQAGHRALVGVFNDHLHRDAGGGSWVDIAGGVVAFDAAASFMDGQDFAEVADCMTVTAWLIVRLAAISERVEQYGMVDSTSWRTMIMAIEVGAVTGGALTTADHGGRDQSTVSIRVVAGGTTFGGMNLTDSDVRGGGGCVARDTVGCEWACGDVFLYLGGMVVVMAVEVAAVAIDTRPTVATVDCRIAIAVGTRD